MWPLFRPQTVKKVAVVNPVAIRRAGAFERYGARQRATHGRPMASQRSDPVLVTEGVRIQRKCSCGGTCPSCSGASKAGGSKAGSGLRVGEPNDIYEKEADTVADRVVRTPNALPPGHGVHPEPAARGLLQAKASSTGERADSSVRRDLGLGSGQPLAPSARRFLEARMGADFSDVRVHSGPEANAAARSLNARAFTVGRHMGFADTAYSPGTLEGRRLLAHELTHVMQQRSGAASRIQRRVEVQPDAAAANDILDQFRFLCPTGNFSLNGRRIESSCTSSSRSCDCLCDVTTDTTRTYTIEVHPVANNPTPVTLHDGSTRTVPMPSVGPATRPGTDPHINMPSSSSSAVYFGAFRSDGSPFIAPNWRILAHELCGHARLNQTYSGSKGDRPQHDQTITTTNDIAAEHGGEVRGTYADPRQGESFHTLPMSGAKLVFKLTDGWHYELVP